MLRDIFWGGLNTAYSLDVAWVVPCAQVIKGPEKQEANERNRINTPLLFLKTMIYLMWRQCAKHS